MSYEGIISIHGAPRSGTSWLGQLFDSSPEVRYKFQPLFAYSFKDRIQVRSDKQEILDFYSELYRYEDDFLDQSDKKENGTYPNFQIKRSNPEKLVTKMVRYHYLIPTLIEQLDNIKFIAIVRNPCGAINSWRKAPREFLPQWDFEQEWRFAESKNLFRPEEYYGFHKWLECTKLFLEMEARFPEVFKIVHYEDLVQHPADLVKELFQFTGLEMNEQTCDFVDQSTSVNKEGDYSVYKGRKDVHEWKDELDPQIARTITDEIKGTGFEKFI